VQRPGKNFRAGGHARANVEIVSDPHENEPDGRTFDADGRLRGRSLRTIETIDGIPCAPNRQVLFHANGRLESAELAGPFASKHGVLPKGTVVELDDSGRIARVTLSEPATLATKNFSAGVAIAFPQDGPPRVE
jgi:hypothetical protein